jgi:hypothetical protein
VGQTGMRADLAGLGGRLGDRSDCLQTSLVYLLFEERVGPGHRGDKWEHGVDGDPVWRAGKASWKRDFLDGDL